MRQGKGAQACVSRMPQARLRACWTRYGSAGARKETDAFRTHLRGARVVHRWSGTAQRSFLGGPGSAAHRG